MSNVCEKHGNLKRNCYICELEEENKELKSLCLWSARRLIPTYKEYVYKDYEKITGDKPERL